MTTTAAAAAAERLRRAANEDAVVVYGTRSSPYPSRKFWGRMEAEEAAKKALAKDEATLADAYIAEHPADDATPLDEAWLNRVGLYDDSHYRDMKLFVILGAMAVVATACEGPKCWNYRVRILDKKGEEAITVFENPTRGTVRALARVLGIPLTGEVQ